ncbi:hypothetical protein KI387_027895, partial [Taxus chinensis]
NVCFLMKLFANLKKLPMNHDEGNGEELGGATDTYGRQSYGKGMNRLAAANTQAGAVSGEKSHLLLLSYCILVEMEINSEYGKEEEEKAFSLYPNPSSGDVVGWTVQDSRGSFLGDWFHEGIGDQDSIIPLLGTRTNVRKLAHELNIDARLPYRAWYHKGQ